MSFKSFLSRHAVGVGTTTTTGRLAGVNTVTGELTFDVDGDVFYGYHGDDFGWVGLSTVTKQEVTSSSGKLMAGVESTIKFVVTGQFTQGNVTVNFNGGGVDQDVTGIITASDGTAGIVTTTTAVHNNISSGDTIAIKVDEAPAFNLTVVTAATGGSITTYVDGNARYRSHSFTSSGSLVVSPTMPVSADYLIIAGGGGGGNANGGGGGGGAGGMRTATAVTLSGATYPVTVGTGGAGTGANSNSQGTDGVDSTFNSVTSTGGGGGGGDANRAGRDGGSGGGAARTNNSAGGSGTSGQGNNGGNSSPGGNAGGGGGGKGNAGGGASNVNAGDGGDGANNAFANGSNVLYAGGGGGGVENNASGGGAPGPGGGGAGGYQANSNVAPTVAGNGTDGKGGGGGGSADSLNNVQTDKAGDGGDGLVVVRYRTDTAN